MRAIMKLGNTCVLDSSRPGVLSRGLAQGFRLDDLKTAPLSGLKHQYLRSYRDARFVFFFHASTDTRHIYGVFNPDGQVHIFYVDKARVRYALL